MDTPPVDTAAAGDDISRTEFLPFLVNFGDLRRRVFLWPAVTTAVFCLALLASTGNQPVFYWFCGAYISIVNLYLIFLCCGKKLPFPYLLSVAVVAFAIDALLYRPIVRAEQLLPSLIAPGLVEETVKAPPLLLVLLVGARWSRIRQREYGLHEPLDGILLAAASATGFAFFETMLVYAPHFGELTTVPRLLDNIFGHIAFSGSFGYFLGLTALKHRHPREVAAAVIIGFVVANLLHDLWDVIGFYSGGLRLIGPVHFVIVAVMSFIVLASMILKARDLSPEREFLWPLGATVPYRAPFVRPLPPVPVHHLSAADQVWLDIGSNRIPLAAGARLTGQDIPGLKSRSADGIVAEVRPHPAEPGELVLCNLSTARWETVLADGSLQHTGPAQTVRLANGTRIDFGAQAGAILVVTREPEIAGTPAAPGC